MLKQTILKSIMANKFGVFQKALSSVASLDEITYEIDEAPLTLQVLNQAFNLPYIDLGDRIVQTEDVPFDATIMRASKVSAYINLLLEKSISDSEVRDFVVAYYGVVATEKGMVIKIDRTLLGMLCKRFALAEPVTIALAKFIDMYSENLSKGDVYDKEPSKDDWSYLEFLIDHGAEPNRVVNYAVDSPASPMGIAGKQGNTRLAKYFIGKGADTHDLLVGGMRISTLLDAGITPVIWPTAIAWDDETDATRFIDSLREYVTQEAMLGEFKLLLASGVNLNTANSSGELPLGKLMWVYTNWHRREITLLQLCKAMIDNGADVNAFVSADNAVTSLMLALYFCEDIIGPHDNDVAEYRYLADLVSMLLELGASVTIKNAQGRTALHYAAKFSPSLLPLLRERIDRAPSGFTEVLLFSGPQRCLSLLEASAEIDESSLQHVFCYAVMLRHRELVDHLSSRRFDVVAALEPLRTEHQKDGWERTYDYELLKFMTKLSSPSLEPFWRDLLIRDYRISAKNIAHAGLAAALSEAAAQTIMAECDEIKVSGQKLIRHQTRVFVSRLRTLFASLRRHKILAVDINGSGWAPSDHGWEVAYEMISPKDLNEFGVDEESDMSICWTDIGYYKREAKGFKEKGRMQYAVTEAYIYYSAPNKAKYSEMVSRIIEVAVGNGFEADWDGDTKNAVLLRLLMPT